MGSPEGPKMAQNGVHSGGPDPPWRVPKTLVPETPKSDPQMVPKWVQNRVKKGSNPIGYESKHCLIRD